MGHVRHHHKYAVSKIQTGKLHRTNQLGFLNSKKKLQKNGGRREKNLNLWSFFTDLKRSKRHTSQLWYTCVDLIQTNKLYKHFWDKLAICRGKITHSKQDLKKALWRAPNNKTLNFCMAGKPPDVSFFKPQFLHI